LDCPEVTEELNRAGIRYRIYKQDVSPNVGTPDQAFLPKVGKHGWVLITADWHQRYRPREIADGEALLVTAKNDIRQSYRKSMYTGVLLLTYRRLL